jgi:GT2 family glycosyltransferase
MASNDSAVRDPEITVSVVAYNQKQYLEKLLPALDEAARLAPTEILVVDHQSQDGSGDYIRSTFPQVQVIRNDARAGYGENHNRNLVRAQGAYFVIMNTDIVMEADAFVRLRAFLEANPDIGMISPRVLNEDGTVQGLNKRYPTVWDLFLRRFLPKGLQRRFQERLDRYEMRDVGYDRSYDVEFLSGSFMFCRTDMLRALGGFDTRYFLYFEDVDLCRRCQQHCRTVYYPDVSVTHLWERAAHKRWIYTYWFARSAVTYFNRWGWRLA